MKADIRRQKIIELLIEQGSASLEQLARQFEVSVMTIHRDLDELEASGLLRKKRGGATIESNTQFESDHRYRARIAAEEKLSIARFASRFIEPGMSVIIDDSSTAQSIVPSLLEKRPLTVITNNLSVIESLTEAAGITLIAVGGNYSRKFNGFFGMLAEHVLSDLRAEVALLSSSSVDGKSVYHQDQEVVGVKRQMLSSSAKSYLLIDHQKFQRTALYHLAGLEVFDGVVSSTALAPQHAQALKENNVPLYLASDE